MKKGRTLVEIKRDLPLLSTLSRLSAKTRRELLKKAKEPLLDDLCSICKNYTHGNLKPTKQLNRYRKIITTLADPSVKKDKKNKIVSQKGGFIPLLLAPLLPLLAKAGVAAATGAIGAAAGHGIKKALGD